MLLAAIGATPGAAASYVLAAEMGGDTRLMAGHVTATTILAFHRHALLDLDRRIYDADHPVRLPARLCVIALGYGVRASGYIPRERWRGVNALNHRLLLPSFLFTLLAQARFDGGASLMIGACPLWAPPS
jgi:predicted permease